MFPHVDDAQNLEHCVECLINTEVLFQDRDKHVRGVRAPDLRLYRFVRGAVEGLDFQVLLYALEEDRDLPSTAVQLGDGQSR